MQKVYNSDGSEVTINSLGYNLGSRTIILQPTTSYTIPSGCRAILVECIGSGGSGGGGVNASNAAAGSGGSAGAYSAKFIVSPKASAYTVSVGLGATAGTAGNHDGNAGNDTTFDSPSVCTAKGGAAGKSGGAGGTGPLFIAGVAGGAAASGVGDIVFDGSPSGASFVASASIGVSGYGGSGPFGGGAFGRVSQASGNTAGQYGSGGSGGLTLSGGAATAGGAGADGVIIVSEYY